MNRHSRFFKGVILAAGLLGVCGATAFDGQEPNPTSQMDQQKIEKQDNGIYLYRVKVVQRDLDAVNYLHRSGSTNIGFQGSTPACVRRVLRRLPASVAVFISKRDFRGLPRRTDSDRST